MTTDRDVQPAHEHGDAWPHDDTHHVVGAFTLLFLERAGAQTIDELATRLGEAQVVQGRIEGGGLARLVEGLEHEGLVVPGERADRQPAAYALTPSGRAVLQDWVAIMRVRRRLARTFLGLYDRADG
jgi:DNA-binding PadR family transcriptional regulator